MAGCPTCRGTLGRCSFTCRATMCVCVCVCVCVYSIMFWRACPPNNEGSSSRSEPLNCSCIHNTIQFEFDNVEYLQPHTTLWLCFTSWGGRCLESVDTVLIRTHHTYRVYLGGCSVIHTTHTVCTWGCVQSYTIFYRGAFLSAV